MGKVQAIKAGLSLVRKGANSLPKESIVPKTLGYIVPGGTINFLTEQTAINYAKNRAISALNCPNPYERMIVVSKNRILDELCGDKNSVCLDMRKYKKLQDNISLYHGHPDFNGKGITPPVSLNDYDTLKTFGDNVDEIVAFNSIGEFSMLKNIHQPKWLPRTLQLWRRVQQVNTCDLKFKTHIFNSINKKKQALMQEMRALFNSDNENFELIEKIAEEINKLGENAQTSKEGMNKIHKFWLNATRKGKYGIEYSTNFSHLIKS